MEIPYNWKLDSVGNLFETVTGSTPPKSQKDNYGNDVPFVKPPELLDANISVTADSLSEKGAASSRTLPSGSVLISCIGNLGKVGVNSQVVAFNQQINAIRPSDTFISKFMFYQALSPWFKAQLEGLASGTTVPIVNKSKFNSIKVVLPPTSEQKRIVAILDQAFADIEQARAKTDQNLKNARELFESYLQQVFSQRGEGWVETTLGEEINLLTGFAFKSKEYVTHSDSVPLIRGDNIVQGKLRWDGVKLWASDKTAEYEKYQLAKDDIVLAMDRTWVKAGMKFSRISDADLPALLVQRVARLRCLNSLNSDYLYHLIGSKLFERYVLSIQTGLGVPHISGKQIQTFRFNKPGIEEQLLVVKTLNKLADKVSCLTEIYQSKLFAIDELKKSILQKAFTGELTNTENKGVAA